MKIKAVIWDVDGTLLNTQEGLTAAYRHAIEQCHLPAKTDEELGSFIGPTPQTIFMTHFGLNEGDAQHAADIFRERYKSHDLSRASLYNGIEGVLDDLREAGIQQAVATNKRQDYATEICELFGLDDYCAPIIGADNENKLTKADLIKKCLEELEISDPSSVVMIGDTEGDKQAAQAAGVQFLGVNYGFGFCNIPGYANSPEEILAILERKKGRLKTKTKPMNIWALCLFLLTGILHFCYHCLGGGNEQLCLTVFGIAFAYLLRVNFSEYYKAKQSRWVESYKRSLFIAICIFGSHICDICFNGYGTRSGVITLIFLILTVAFLKEIRIKGKTSWVADMKKDLLYRNKFLNGMHRRIREIAKIRNDGITIGVVGSWGEGKTYMIDMLRERLREELKEGKQISNGYNRAFKICAPVELWQAASLDDAWNRVIYSLHTCILGKPPFTQTKFWRMLFNLASVNEVAKQIFEIVEPEFEEFNRESIEKYIGDSRVVLIFDDLERAKFEIVQAMLPLLERLKKIPHLIVICALAEDELCELMRRNKVSPEYTYGHLNKLFDLRIEIPEMGEDAVKNYLKLLFETKHKGCELTKSFFRHYHIRFDNPRQMDRIVDKSTSIESQYFLDLHKELDFGNYSMAFDQTSTQVLYIYVVEALRIINPYALKELVKDYGTEEGKIPSRFLSDPISSIITSSLERQPPSEKEQEWVRKHPETYNALLKGRAFPSFLNIICDPENHHNPDENRKLFMSAFCGAYKRNTALSGIEAGIIMKKNINGNLALSKQIQNYYRDINEKYEPSFLDRNVRAFLEYLLGELEQKDDGVYMKYIENSLKTQCDISPKIQNIFLGHEFSKLIERYIKLDELDDPYYSGDIKKFIKLGSIFKLVYNLMSLKDQADVLNFSCQKLKEIGKELPLHNPESDEIILTYRNFIGGICFIYGEHLYQAIKDKDIISITEVPRYSGYRGNEVANLDYVEEIGQGVACKLGNKTESKSFYIPWLRFLGTRNVEGLGIDEESSSCITKEIASISRFIKDKIREQGDEFYSTLSPKESKESLKQCNESIDVLEYKITEWMGYQVGSEIAATEYSEGIDELLSILREEKTEIEKVMASQKSPLRPQH